MRAVLGLFMAIFGGLFQTAPPGEAQEILTQLSKIRLDKSHIHYIRDITIRRDVLTVALNRGAIADALRHLIESAGIEVQNKATLLSALRNFAQTDVNFVDAYHAAIAAAESITVASFDRDFDQFPGVKRVEPKT